MVDPNAFNLLPPSSSQTERTKEPTYGMVDWNVIHSGVFGQPNRVYCNENELVTSL